MARNVLLIFVTVSLLLCAVSTAAQDAIDDGLFVTEGAKFLREGRFADALAAFDRSLVNRPENSLTHMHRGYALIQLGQPRMALEALVRARSLLGDSPDVPWYFQTRTYQAVALGMIGDVDASISLFTEVIASEPTVEAYHGRAQSYVKKGLYDLAAADFRSISRLVPGDEQYELVATVLDEMHASSLFVLRMAGTPGAVQTASGLIYIEREPGAGPHPSANDSVEVRYRGSLRDGTVFDGSVDSGTTATFPLDTVIGCLSEGVQKLRVGGRARVVCPSHLGYGSNGAHLIPPGAALQFEIELLGIEAASD